MVYVVEMPDMPSCGLPRRDLARPPRSVLQVMESKLPVGQIPGLPNLGNTCFMNAVLQCLLNTPGRLLQLLSAFRSPQGPAARGLVAQRLAELAAAYGGPGGGRHCLEEEGRVLEGLKLALVDREEGYASCQQQDAYEFLGHLLEGLDEELVTLLAHFGHASPGDGIVRKFCGITTRTKRLCHGCRTVFSADRVTDTALRLPLISPAAQMDAGLRSREERELVALEELIEAVQEPEEIRGYDCDTCAAALTAFRHEADAKRVKTVHARSTITQRAGLIAGTSDILIVALYRFLNVLDGDGEFTTVKIRRRVAIPTVMSLETGLYRLYGVVSHMGESLSSGHYVAAVRSLRDHHWYDCDDSQVRPIGDRCLSGVSEITETRPNADPFILFYHRVGGEIEHDD
uniref:Ubiquitin carboxyl-terminal hydrolase n=1 Tax=Alexandrium monilatum TaxID=311494 RepID=A0A7S4VA68_9DINO